MKLYTKIRCVKVRGLEAVAFTEGKEYPLGFIPEYGELGVRDDSGEILYMDSNTLTPSAYIPGFDSVFEVVE